MTAEERIGDVRAWARSRIERCTRIVAGEAPAIGFDLPEAMAERRTLRAVLRILEGCEDE